MVEIHPNYIVNENSERRSVILPYDEWKKILADMEELDDIRAYDDAKSNEDETIPFEKAVEEIRSSNPE